MSDTFEPRPIEDPTSLINKLTLRFSLHAVAEHSAAFESGVSGYYDFWSPLRTNLFFIRHQLQSNKVLTSEDRVWLLASLEIMADELEFFTQLVVGDIQTGESTPENLMGMRGVYLVRWNQMIFEIKGRV